VKNGTRGYQDCVARCARGFRCRRLESGADPRRCALLCAGVAAVRRHRRRLWADILRQEPA
jgi:hypothetical protein